MFTNIIKRSINLGAYQMFNGIEFNDNVALSIQASIHHACSPRINFGFAKDYESFEVFISCDDSSYIPSFMNEYLDRDIYKDVPKEVVHKLVEYYREKHGLKYWHDEILYRGGR